MLFDGWSVVLETDGTFTVLSRAQQPRSALANVQGVG